MTNDPTAGRADHREGARPPAREGEMPPELRRLHPPATPADLRRRALRAAEAELRATGEAPFSPNAPVAASAAMALRRAVESVFRSRVFWLAWSAALLLLLLLPTGERLPQSAPAAAVRTASSPTSVTSVQVSAGGDLQPIRLKTGPTVDDLRRRRDPFTSEGIFHHEL